MGRARLSFAFLSLPGALRRRHLTALLALYLTLGFLYSILTPLFEAGDEIWHYPFVQHIATTGELPVQDPANKGRWEQEGGQPPLYYVLMAGATAWIDTRDLPDLLWYNPHAQIGIPLAFGNKNMIVHTGAEAFPWRGTTLAVHLIRLLSVLLGAVTVVCTYETAHEVLGAASGRRSGSARADGERAQGLALVAAALVAFNPMFLFIMASVNNDSLAVALASLALLGIVRLVTRGPALRRFVWLGIVLGLGALTKQSDLGLCFIMAAVVLSLMWRTRLSRLHPLSQNEKGDEGIQSLFLGAVIAGTMVLLIAGWWYVRNFLLYGDPTGLNVWLKIAGTRPQPIGALDLIAEFQGFRISFWGNFGGVNLIAPEPVYTLLDLLSLAALLGLLFGLWRRSLPPLLGLLGLWVGLETALLVRWTLLTFASQGRLIFPAISALAVLLVAGLDQWSAYLARPFSPALDLGARPSAQSPRQRVPYPLLPLSLALVLFLFATLTPFALIRPAYAQPPHLADEMAVPNPVHILFEGGAELVGYALPQRSVKPGESLPVILYWRTQEPLDEDYTVYIHLFDARGNAAGQWDAFPGNGLVPTRLWQPRQILVDTYRVPVSTEARGPQVGRVEAGLYRRKGLANLTATDPQGNLITPTLGRFKIAGPPAAVSSGPPEATFGGTFALVRAAVEPTTRLSVTLTWRAVKPPDRDYTLFAHLVDRAGVIVSQHDDQPQNKSYPTSFWDAGELVQDSFTLDLPSGGRGPYRIELGWYDAATLSRLPNDLGGDSYVLESIPAP